MTTTAEPPSERVRVRRKSDRARYDAETGATRQASDDPVGLVDGLPTLDGEWVLWFDDAELAAWPTVAATCAAAMNGVKGEANTVNRRRHWASPLDASLYGNSVSRPTFEAMHDAVTASLPDFRHWMRSKARLHGHDGALPWWDLSAPLPFAPAEITWDEGLGIVRTAFGAYGGSLAGIVDRAIDERWIGVNVKGKGLVILSACSHAGIVNVLTHARASFPDLPLHAVMGGFHLSGEKIEPIIPDTVRDMQAMALSLQADDTLGGIERLRALVDLIRHEGDGPIALVEEGLPVADGPELDVVDAQIHVRSGIDRAVAATHLKPILSALAEAGCEIRGDENVVAAFPSARPATEADWTTEYLDAIIAVKVVDGVAAAIASGFSEYTCLPASRASLVTGKWRYSGTAM